MFYKRIISVVLSVAIAIPGFLTAFRYTVKAIGELTVNSDNKIVISEEYLPSGQYSLEYVSDDFVLDEYEPICYFESDGKGDFIYDGFIEENAAPYNATGIGVIDSERRFVLTLALNNLQKPVSKKLYSFGAVSDIHIGARTAEDDFINALTFLENEENVDFTTVCGDIALSGTVENFEKYKSIVDTYSTKPIYETYGNHDANFPFGPLEYNSLSDYTDAPLYYSFEKNNDVYIMFGMADNHEGEQFAPGALQWLYETLEQNRNKRCFLFMHLFDGKGSGDAVDLDIEGEKMNNTQGKVFYSMLAHYKNVLYFHGHSHQSFRLQVVNKMNNYDNCSGYHSIHIPSLAYPKTIKNSNLVSVYEQSEGYIADVYEDSIVLRGRDFANSKFVPVATYYLDTSLTPIDANTFYDSTGTIINDNSNILCENDTWYKSSIDKKQITEISFVDRYSDSYDEFWDASVSQQNLVKVYRKGTRLYIEGNENGVVANTLSKNIFSGFTNLVNINEIEKLKTENIKDIDGGFKNCEKLKSLNLASFKGVRPLNMMNVFSGCKALESIDLSVFDLSDVNKYTNLFYNCSSMANINLGESCAKNTKTLYCINMFQGCSKLKTIDVSFMFDKTINIGGAFKECVNLTDIILQNNKVIGFSRTFEGCVSLKEMDLSSLSFTDSENTLMSFYDCKSLENIILSQSLTAIGDKYFYGCESLKNIIVPEGVGSIGDKAFGECTSLQQITLPESVKNINSTAFENCLSLTDIYTELTREEWKNINTEFLLDGVTVHFKNEDDVFLDSEKSFVNIYSGIVAPTTIEGASYQWYGCNKTDRTDAVLIRGANSKRFLPMEMSQLYAKNRFKYYYCVETSFENSYHKENITPLCFNVFSLIKEAPQSFFDFSEMVIYSDCVNNINSLSGILQLSDSHNAVCIEPSYVYNDIKAYGTGSKLVVGDTTGNKTVIDIVVLGDVNADGVIDVLDVSDMAKFLEKTELQDLYLKAADVNADGIVSASDYQIVVNKAMN